MMNGLLRTSSGRAGPAFSSTLYVVSLNITVIAGVMKTIGEHSIDSSRAACVSI